MPGEVNMEAGLVEPVEAVVEAVDDGAEPGPPHGLGNGAEFSPVAG